SVDGTQAWENVPLKRMKVIASKDASTVESAVFLARANHTIELVLPAGEGSVFARVSDKFTLAPIAGAVITLLGEEKKTSICTTNASGECVAKIIEGKTVAKVKAGGFEDFEASEFEVIPNAFTTQDFAILSQGTADAGLYFQGIFDLKGNKVKTLSPFTTYNAKYVLVSGGLNFTLANAHVRIGSQEEPLENLPAVISGYKSFGVVQRGVDYSQASSFVPALATQAGGQKRIFITQNGFSPSNIVIQAGESVTWVSQDNETHVISAEDASFQSPELRRGASFSRTFPTEGMFYYIDALRSSLRGTITVAGRSSSTQSAQAQDVKGVKWVDYSIPSTAFKGSKELSIQIKTVESSGSFSLEHRSAFQLAGGTVRKPEDSQAGVAKNELLANALESGVFEISSEGTCEKDYCVKYWFENGKQNNFEALFGQKFKLFVRVYSDSSSQVSIAGDNAIAVESAEDVTGGESAVAQSNALSLSVEPKGGVADVEALFSPAKLASDAAITLKVNSWEKKIHLRVVSKDKLSLVEKHSPKEILALQDSKVSFALEDSLGFPVEDAVVMLNDVQAGEATAGTYEVSLSPDFVGEAEYSISKEGFPVLAGAIPITAPEKFVSISPAGVQASVTGEPVSVELNLENLLNNEVSFTARVETGSSPAITSLSVSPSKKTLLKALEQKDVVLNASLQEGILPFAEKPARLQEAVSGSVVFVFTVGKYSQEERVPLNVTSSVDQKTLDDLWFLESESMEFVLSAEEPFQSKTLRIDSQSPVPLLINLNLNESGLYATPASLTVEANSFAEFNVTKTIPDEISSDCFALEKEEEQTLGIVASYQGILSKKSVEVKNSFIQDENCKPSNESVELQLPFTDYLLLSGSVETKENPDGTLAMRVGGKEGEVLGFDAGASVVNETNRLAV
ncbi:MAG: hypothetical protein V1717_03475, partial [Candidatus Micrarchaeota archaeon]